MDQQMAEGHLALAERHVSRGRLLVARQHEVVIGLARLGHDVRLAEDLLAQFEMALETFIADLDRIQKDLATIDSDVLR